MMTLEQFFHEYPKAALGFSGGVDSSYLLYAAKQYGADVTPYYVKTDFQPDFEYEDAVRLAGSLGAEMRTIRVDVLENEAVARNDSKRCYYCKLAIFGTIARVAQADGCLVVIDGTNASDSETNRPGMQALKELGVLSPLRMCGLDKAEVRARSREAGLFTWDKPAYSCLATRMESGRTITQENLKRAERAETALFSLGFTDFRIRTEGNGARIEMPAPQMEKCIELREQILRELADFSAVALDLRAR